MDRNESQGKGKGGKGATGGGEQQKDVREGFGDDMGTRVGRPDPAGPGALDDRSRARLSENADDRGIEGGVLSSPGQRSSTRADGSSMEGEPLDHAQRAQSGTPERGSLGGGARGASAPSGAGGEANQGVHGAQRNAAGSGSGSKGAPAGADIKGGTDEHSQGAQGGTGRSGSEPLRERQSEHKSGYGGEGGAPRESKGPDYYGDEGTKK